MKRDWELDIDFLGFLDDYRDLAGKLPKGMAVVDLGCADSIQAVYFCDRVYTGVDCGTEIDMRYKGTNVHQYKMTIQDYCESLKEQGFDKDNVFAFCCNVPDNGVWKIVRDTFNYYRITFPMDCYPHNRYFEEKIPNER